MVAGPPGTAIPTAERAVHACGSVAILDVHGQLPVLASLVAGEASIVDMERRVDGSSRSRGDGDDPVCRGRR